MTRNEENRARTTTGRSAGARARRPDVAQPARPGAMRGVLAAVSLALLASCAGEGSTVGAPGDGGNGGSGTASYASVQSEIFDRRCTSASCHSSVARQGGLSLVARESYENLVNVEPQNPAAVAAGWLRVVPDIPDQSFLLRKLTGDLAPGEGSPMPLGGAPLNQEEIDLIRDWIADGALLDD
jgi:hypothetical protein